MKFLTATFLFLLTQGFIFSGKIFGQMEGKPEIEMISDRLRLSYVIQVGASNYLSYTVFGLLPEPNRWIAPPVVVALLETKFHETVPDHEKTFPHTETDPINDHFYFTIQRIPFQLEKLENRRFVHRSPCAKIMIEAMVLNIPVTG